MIWLDRGRVRVPADWVQRVARALPDRAAYDRAAREFERLGINSTKRRDGFKKFAPQVLKEGGGKRNFPSIWGDAKDALAGMSHQKCAYCEHPLNARRSGQVEHFKPKSLFPSLAYDWDNYFLACGGCNGAKGDNWPKMGGYVRPDQGDPSKQLLFQTDGTVKAVRIASNAERTIKDFDLNRSWLVRLRKRALTDLLSRLEIVAQLHRSDKEAGLRLARNEFKRARDPENPYSSALRQCFLHGWRSALPGARL